MDTKLMENMVANQGFVREYRPRAQRLSVGAAVYRITDGVVTPAGSGELKIVDLLLVAAARRKEFSKEVLLEEMGVDSPAGRRAFAGLVRAKVFTRTNASQVVHIRNGQSVATGEVISVYGRVFRVSKAHPRKRQIDLDLEDGSRAVALTYGAEAVVGAGLRPGTLVRITCVQLKSRPYLFVRATDIAVTSESA